MQEVQFVKQSKGKEEIESHGDVEYKLCKAVTRVYMMELNNPGIAANPTDEYLDALVERDEYIKRREDRLQSMCIHGIRHMVEGLVKLNMSVDDIMIWLSKPAAELIPGGSERTRALVTSFVEKHNPQTPLQKKPRKK